MYLNVTSYYAGTAMNKRMVLEIGILGKPSVARVSKLSRARLHDVMPEGLGPDHVGTKSSPPLLQAHGPLPLRRCARDRMVIAL